MAKPSDIGNMSNNEIHIASNHVLATHNLLHPLNYNANLLNVLNETLLIEINIL